MPGLIRRLSPLQRYLAALAAVALAAGVRWTLSPLVGTRFPYLLQYLVLLACARYFGFGPAMAGLVLGTSPLMFGMEFIARPPVLSGVRFWAAAISVYGLSTALIWIFDRQRRISLRLEAEMALSAQLQAIVESSDDAIISKDLDGIVRTWNRGAEQIYGYSAEEMVGRSIGVLVPDDRKHEESDMIERIRRGGRLNHFETVRLRKDGGALEISMTMSPIRNGRGEIVGVSHISRDITEKKRWDEQLRQTQKLESLGVLAGGLAHDFNNLLTGIMGNASLAGEEMAQGHPSHRYIDEVVSASERAALLIRQMLAYAGKGQFVIAHLDLSEQVTELLPLIRPSFGGNVRLDLKLASGLPSVDADPGQIQQVIMNLVINASEAIGSQPGTVTVRTWAGAGVVNLEVQDTGVGMDEATRSRIFDPFFSTKFTGRGLGLAAVLGIIRTHRGDISVESTPGQGSIFRVTFPAADGEVVGQTAVEAAGDLRGSGRILVVDDEDLVRNMARFTLERYGYAVECAGNGEAAIAAFAARPLWFDLVLLDLTMPEMDGEQTMLRLRDIRADVRVLLSSGFSEAEALRRFQDRGLVGFLQKPYTAGVLARRVKEALG